MTAVETQTRKQAERELMKAFVMQGIGSVGFMQKPRPACGPNDAIVRTTKALICTSDSHTVAGAVGERHGMTLGHEAVGIVEEVGSEVRHFKPGDRVVAGAITPDWGDPASQMGHSSQSSGPLGGWKFSNVKDGVFAEFFHVNEADANLALIPADVPDEKAVYCCDMLSTGFAGAESANIPIGGIAAIFALGPVGLMAVAGARLRGAGTIVGVDAVPKRQELAKRYGASIIVDPSKGDVVKAILDLTGGIGVDSAVEALGAEATFAAAIDVTRPGYDLQRRLPRGRRDDRHPARRLGRGNGGENDHERPLPRWKVAYGTSAAHHSQWHRGSHTDDDASLHVL